MRIKQTQNIKEIITVILQQNNLEGKLAEVRLIRAWEELLGKTIARYTKRLYIKNKILYVSVSSSVVRNELLLIRDELMKKLNETAGNEIIHKIILK